MSVEKPASSAFLFDNSLFLVFRKRFFALVSLSIRSCFFILFPLLHYLQHSIKKERGCIAPTDNRNSSKTDEVCCSSQTYLRFRRSILASDSYLREDVYLERNPLQLRTRCEETGESVQMASIRRVQAGQAHWKASQDEKKLSELLGKSGGLVSSVLMVSRLCHSY